MAYNSLIPQGRDRFYISQGDMLNNFQSINTVTRANHIELNDADQGKHEVIQLTLQDTDVSTSNGTNIAALYSVASTAPNTSTATTLRFRREADGAFINFTEFGFSINTNKDFTGVVPIYMTAYWNRLPNGTLIKIFTAQLNVNPTNSSTAAIQTASTNFGPAFTSISYVTMVPQRVMTVNPNDTSTGDPNVVIHVTGTTTTTISYIAFVRNLFNFGRQSPKQFVNVRTVIWGT